MLKIVDNYTLSQYLGKGEYGKVYKGSNIDTKIDVAIKMIPLKKFDEISKLAQLTRNELEILKMLHNNINVINFVEMIKTNHHIYLVYEYCEGGTLEDYIRLRGHIPEKEALTLFKQLINAFKDLNQHHILHRDVKPNNIFFKSGHLKLADFGFCKRLKNYDDLTQTSLGSPLYMAPEVLNGDVYGSKADVWSVGIVLYEMLFGHSPFGDCNIKQLINLYGADKLRVPMESSEIFISPVTENMLRKMLEKDQFKRISWEDFFYEYEIDEYGCILKKEKDFEYDLMKLMKKNSSHISMPALTSKISHQGLKFDWSKITDKNSSVHSEELNYEHRIEEGEMDELLTLKKKVKQFELEHEKRVQLISILDEMVEAPDHFHYSEVICYFLLFNLHSLIQRNLPEIQQFMQDNKEILLNCPLETNLLNKITVVFKNQAQALSNKINLMKMALISGSQTKPNFLKYPQQGVMTQQTANYLKQYEQKFPGITSLSAENEKIPQHELTFLIRALWGVSTIKKEEKRRELNIVSIKPETSTKQLQCLLNKLMVYICG